jgi:hypothetical protein
MLANLFLPCKEEAALLPVSYRICRYRGIVHRSVASVMLPSKLRFCLQQHGVLVVISRSVPALSIALYFIVV